MASFWHVGSLKASNPSTIYSPPIPKEADDRLRDCLLKLLQKDPQARIGMAELRVG